MIETIYLLIITFIYFLSVFLVGKLITNKFFSINYSPLRISTYFGLGNMFFSIIFHYLGIFNILYKELLIIFMLLPLLILFKNFKDINYLDILNKFLPNKISYFYISLIFFLIFPLLPHLFLLPVSWDGTAYHLALPKVFLEAHYLPFYEWFPQTTYPVGLIGLYGFAESLNEIRLANFMAFSFIPMTMYLLTIGLQKSFPNKILLFALIVSMFKPLLYSESATATFIDYGFSFYGLLTAIYLYEYIKTKEKTWFFLFLIFLFFNALIKLTGLFFITSAIVILIVGIKDNEISIKEIITLIKNNIRLSLLFLISIIPTIYWYTRNYYYTHNPFHPYFNDIFKGYDYDPASYVSITADVKQLNDFTRITISNYLHGRDTFIDYVNLSEILFVIMTFSTLTFGIFLIKDKSFKYLYIFALLILFPIVYFIGSIYRYYLPIVPIIGIILGKLLEHFIYNFKIIFILPLLFIITSLFIQLDAVNHTRTQLYLSTNKREYIRYLWNYEYLQAKLDIQENFDVIKYANKNLNPNKTKIVFLFDNRIYYFNSPTQFMNPSIFGYFTNPKTENIEEILAQLETDGITHLVVSENWGRHATLRTELFEKFISEKTTPLYSSRKVTLYKIDYK